MFKYIIVKKLYKFSIFFFIFYSNEFYEKVLDIKIERYYLDYKHIIVCNEHIYASRLNFFSFV